jgi:predicted metal-binding membrane protein
MDQPLVPGSALRRERFLTLAVVAALAGSAWGLLGAMSYAGLGPPGGSEWGFGEIAALFTMWLVMMVAMMLPAATPVFLLYPSVLRSRQASAPLGFVAAFLGGYVAVWAGFSALAAASQYLLHSAGLLSSDATRVVPRLGGVLLIAAGVWQWTPIKDACLRHCRSPLHFLNAAWREGVDGALAAGARHGLLCLGCCWMLMALLFVAGVMNLLWVAALSALVLVEKLAPAGLRLGRAWGVVLMVSGVWLLAR